MGLRAIPKSLSLFICFIVVLTFVSNALADKEYRIDDVYIEARLQEDGSADILESRTYRFTEGEFRYAFQTFPATGQVSYEGFQVSEDELDYQRSESESPGTYSVRQGESHIEVRWFFRAEEESRTFSLHYKINDAVLLYDDAAVFYFQFIGDEWPKRQDNIELRVIPPESILPSDLNAWLHGPLWGEYRIESDGSITAWCQRLPRRSYFEIRALYPIGLFNRAQRRSALVRQVIMDQEAEWAEEANRMREEDVRKFEAQKERWELGKWIMLGITLVGIYLWSQIYRKYGKKPTLPELPKIASDIPDNSPPAFVGYLLNDRQIYGGALVGTLFALARREILAMRQEEEERKIGGTKTMYFWDLKREKWNADKSKLSNYENDLINFFFNELAEGEDTIDVKTIQKKQTKFMKFFQEWKKDVKEEAKEKGWWDEESIKGLKKSLALSGILIAVTIPSAFLFGPWAVILGTYACIVLVLSLIIPHRTQEGERLAQHWKALKRYMNKYEFRTADSNLILRQIDRYFVYGVVLGLQKKVFKELAAFLPADNHARYIPWYVFHETSSGGFSPDAFASSFSTMIATTTSAMSSASGAGGGASVGGGGGAGGGGGGAG